MANGGRGAGGPRSSGEDVTVLLRAWRGGDAEAGERLFALLYRELKEVARQWLVRERRGATLQTTALVHEAYLRLVGQRRVDWRNRGHFLALAATMMRRILVDRARARKAAKRGFGETGITLTDSVAAGVAPGTDLLDVDRALERMASPYPRAARVVELRFFGGLELEEIGAVLGVSERTVKRDWAFARAWLEHELS